MAALWQEHNSHPEILRHRHSDTHVPGSQHPCRNPRRHLRTDIYDCTDARETDDVEREGADPWAVCPPSIPVLSFPTQANLTPISFGATMTGLS